MDDMLYFPTVIDGPDESKNPHRPEVQEFKIKCTDCDKVTTHGFFYIQPRSTEPESTVIMDIPLRRKIIICGDCGKLSLKK